MEELRIDFSPDDLEEIEKMYGSKFPFPVVHFGDSALFNRETSKAGLIGDAVKWFTTPEYVIGLPAKPNTANAFAVWRAGRNKNCALAKIPAALSREKKVASGYYKLYKYKNGFAFKRYEPLPVE